MFYYQMCQSGLLMVLQTLKAAGALVILPAGSDTIMKHIADEIIYVDPPIDLRPLC
jgi:hypothetical protein